MTGRNKDKERGFSHRSLSEEEIEKLGNWQVGTFHRGSTSKPQASADDPMRPPRSGGTLQGDTDGEVQSSTTESKPSAPVQREGGSTTGSTKSSFAENIDAALEKAKQQYKGQSLDDLELEREKRLRKEGWKKK